MWRENKSTGSKICIVGYNLSMKEGDKTTHAHLLIIKKKKKRLSKKLKIKNMTQTRLLWIYLALYIDMTL